jgi:V-type H+-transporting ATPase subunit F
MLLAGIGQVDSQQRRNYVIVDSSTHGFFVITYQQPLLETSDETIANSFQYLTERPDIAVLLINQHVLLTQPRELLNTLP